MQCFAGHRYVFLVGPLVFKVPRIRIISFFHIFFRYVRYWIENRRGFWFKFRTTFFHRLCEGMMENFCEAKCYLTTRHRLLARLYLPLLFVNVYKRESGTGLFECEHISSLEANFEKAGFDSNSASDMEFLEACEHCGHSFSPSNFAFRDGRIKILDSGEPGFTYLLENYGDRLERFLLWAAHQYEKCSARKK